MGAFLNIDLPDAEWYTRESEDLDALVREVAEDVHLIAIDTETTGLNVVKDMPLFWSMSWGERRLCLHADALPAFKDVFSDPSKKWVLANAKYDQHILSNVGLPLAGDLIDVQVMHALLFEEQPHGLKYIAEHVLGWVWNDFKDTFRFNKGGKLTLDSPASEVVDSRGNAKGAFRSVQDAIMWSYKNDLHRLIEYASNDAYGTMQSYISLKRQLEESNIHSLYPDRYRTLADYFFKIEVPFTRVLWTCERHGARVDQSYLDGIEKPVRQELDRIEREIAKTAGRLLNPNSTPDLRKFFFNECKLKVKKLTKGGKSGNQQACLDADVLEELSYEHPVAQLVLNYRELDKLLGTYVKGLGDHMDHRGRIHTRFNQDVARCMPAGELVLTNRGYIPVQDVHVGDLVITHTGDTKPVVGTSAHPPEPIYKVTLESGLTLRTNGAHQYRANDGWCRADQLQPGDTIAVHSDPEQWVTITGWEDFEVSSWGRVYNKKTRRYLTQKPKGEWGHLKVCLYRNGAQERGEDRKDFSVHKLVLHAFSLWGEGMEARHLNGIAWDNTFQNLRWGTSHENRQDALRHGTMSQRRAGRTQLTETQVQRIKELGSPGQPPSCTSKLTYEKAQEIRTKYASGVGRAELGREYGVSFQAVDNIVKDKTWTKNPVQGPTAEQLASEYGVSAGTIRAIWAGRRWQDEDYIVGKRAHFATSRVVSITVEEAEPTYGLEVADDHSHVTGGIVTHNTGRLSSADPNLQNIPNPEKDKFKIRKAFIPADDHDMIVADYDTLEMRLLACASMEPSMVEMIKAGRDIHMGNATLVFGKIDGFDYDEIAAAKKMQKKVNNGELPDTALTARMHQLLRRRVEIKTIGFGQPVRQAEVKPHQNGELFAARAA